MSGPIRIPKKRKRLISQPYELTSHSNPVPLLVYYHSETSGLDPYNDRIIEIGATIDSSVEMSISKPKTFSSQISTSEAIHPMASLVNGILKEDLIGKDCFTKVLKKFLIWLKSKCDEASKANTTTYYPVLVAHKGYDFFYKFLISEIKRNKIHSKCFTNIKFSDSLQHLKQIKKFEENPIVHELKKLGLESVYQHYYHEEDYKGHPSIVAADNLKRLFSETPLKDLLPFKPEESLEERAKDWKSKFNQKKLRDRFGISHPQAKRLDTLGLSPAKIRGLYDEDPDFDDSLHEMGVYSKPLRQKLYDALKWT